MRWRSSRPRDHSGKPGEPFRIFVVGTDTSVGKTEAACALLSLLAEAGAEPAPFKPYESGCGARNRPKDALALREAAHSIDALEDICVHRLREPLAPGIAATREGRRCPFGPVLAAYRNFQGRSLVAEAAGGLRVPLDRRLEVIDLVSALQMPTLLVARAGLGTLNHTALSLEALARRRIPVRAVLLVESRSRSDPSVAHNADWLARRHRIPVLGPVPFRVRPQARRDAFRAALHSLV